MHLESTGRPLIESQESGALRRKFLSSMLLFVAGVATARAKIIFGGMPWFKDPAVLPTPVVAGGIFTADEVAIVEAIADRLIPVDDLGMGGKEAGCATFIDRQLSGDCGKAATQYRLGEFKAGTLQQGPQFSDTPAEHYRKGLAALDRHCRDAFRQPFSTLGADQQDALLSRVEAGQVALGEVEPKAFFNMILQNVREGYFAEAYFHWGIEGIAASSSWPAMPQNTRYRSQARRAVRGFLRECL